MLVLNSHFVRFSVKHDNVISSLPIDCGFATFQINDMRSTILGFSSYVLLLYEIFAYKKGYAAPILTINVPNNKLIKYTKSCFDLHRNFLHDTHVLFYTAIQQRIVVGRNICLISFKSFTIKIRYVEMMTVFDQLIE